MLNTCDIDAYLIPGTDADVLEHYRGLAGVQANTPVELVEDDIIVADTETTGLDSVRDELIEIAAVRLRGTRIVDRFETFVDPGRHIPEEITELTGITDDDVAGAPDPQVAVEQFAAFAAGSDIAAHNAQFDRSFIMAQAVPGDITGQWVDTLALARITLPRMKTHRLADLARAFGVHSPSHRAMDDVIALAELWPVMMVALHSMPAGLADYIAKISPETTWPLRKFFQRAAAANPGAEFSLRRIRRERTRVEYNIAKYDAREVPLDFVKEDEVKAAFTPQGVAGRMYSDYEQRDEQVQMALEVAGAFECGAIKAIEAGTGVGKSMAYLLPVAQFAKANAVTCGVATKTNALMDQLVYYELPRLSRALGGIDYMALKGYDHYPCLRKVERYARELEDASCEDIEALAMLLAYIVQTGWGDLDALNYHWFGSQRSTVQASAQSCLKRKCPYFPRSCYLHGARRNANSADIVVTNHALLFRDVQFDGGILPPVRHWIIDEAHSAESEARKQLSLEISARELDFLLTRLTSTRSGVIAHVRKKAPEVDGGKMLYGVTTDIDTRAGQVQALSTSFFSFVKDLDSVNPDAGGTYDRVTLWVGPELRESGAWAALGAPGRSLATKLDGLKKRMDDLNNMLDQFENVFTTQQADLSNASSALEGMIAALTLVLDGEDDSYVYSVQFDRNPERVAEMLVAEKLDIGAELLGSFYPNVLSAVFTSATLSTGSSRGPFAHFTHTMGLDRIDAPEPGDDAADCATPARVSCVQLDSSYDFEHNMTIFLPDDLPEPNAHGHREALAEMLYELHMAMGGSTLTLFTNRREMEALYHQLKPRLQDAGLSLAAQLRGSSTKALRDRFLEDRSLSLFALRSFWEGFDAPGDTLRCVIIPRLPFGRPTDPINCERKLREERAAWGRYSLPEAVMDLKQAAGRLIRKSTDSGYLVLADTRLQTKRYGKTFLKAMPTTNIQVLATSDIAAAMRTARSENHE